jgi:hypothetical protein
MLFKKRKITTFWQNLKELKFKRTCEFFGKIVITFDSQFLTSFRMSIFTSELSLISSR